MSTEEKPSNEKDFNQFFELLRLATEEDRARIQQIVRISQEKQAPAIPQYEIKLGSTSSLFPR